MRSEKLLRRIATELPAICRQVESHDPILRAAAANRLRDFADLTEPWRGMATTRVSRRGLLRTGATFIALSLKHDD